MKMKLLEKCCLPEKKKKNSDNHLLVLMTYTCSWSSAAVFRNIRYIHENTFELGKKIIKNYVIF